MTGRLLTFVTVLALGTAVTVTGQTRLSLAEAIARARTQNLDVRAATAGEREAGERVAQARAGYLPTIDLTQAWQRGNQPTFVFSSLLAQRLFTADHFAIDALNRPDPVNNFRTALTVEQALFEPDTAPRIEGARIGREIAAAERAAIDLRLATDVTDAYGRVLMAAAAKQAAAAAMERASADRAVAGNRRDAGRVTDADVLQLDVYVARVREQHIRADADERIARATLNQLMGDPLDATFELTLDAPSGATPSAGSVAALEDEAVANRPEVRIAILGVEQAEAGRRIARAAFLPRIGAHLGWETNGARWNATASSWTAGAVVRINVFQGFADRARVAEAREQTTRRTLEREKAESAARLDVRIALARLDEARAREVAGRAAVEQARESQRIIRNRYESGLADVVALLRAAEAVQEAETRQIGAGVGLALAAAMLDRAVGKR